MAFFDFLNPQKGGLSLAEMLGIPAEVAGQYLMQRNRRLGGPLGAALTGFGALGQQLGQRQAQQAQNLQLADALRKLGPKFAPVVDFVEKGGSVSDAMGIVKELNAKSEEGTPQKITANGIGGLLFPNSGREQWLGKGESFYEKPEKDDIYAITAKEIGLRKPRDQWSQADWQAIREQISKDKLAGEKPNVTNFNFAGFGIGPDGTPVALERSPSTGRVTTAPLPTGVTPSSLIPKSAKATKDLIDDEMKNARAEWEANYKFKSGGLAGVLGPDVSDPTRYTRLAAARKIAARGIVPDDIKAIDPAATFTGRLDMRGNPVYQTSKGLKASEAF